MSPTQASTPCPLCQHQADWFCSCFNIPQDFYRCSNCLSIFKPSKYFVDADFEEERYRTHNNDVHDKRYQSFVSPITNAVKRDFSSDTKGLDYGCGTGPVATYVLEHEDYNITLYDPYFYPDSSYENEEYDFIICCEVMEHFYEPNQEFEKLKNLLKPNAKLYCKTKMITNDFSVENFKNWHYKNDPTHVFFYSPKTLQVICQKFGFKSVSFDEKLITFNT
ncbi:class I SAM-dependent methyltransferase [Flavobacterium sp. CS20]|jgi:SAM-dependent methyltransferase|uniref:class I SAM-dependent methyltransferase n=1 Tax=Flavobacterium sp. CS20 TaxID=2775246 RepID=UPI001B3A4865|nr:class I SAM-dependent methyltransferase [Flavobacterium sp. CS20]QTY25945.1 class I SAM-dependent methyltransferase [Flavobacterium sp. CS20]